MAARLRSGSGITAAAIAAAQRLLGRAQAADGCTPSDSAAQTDAAQLGWARWLTLPDVASRGESGRLTSPSRRFLR